MKNILKKFTIVLLALSFSCDLDGDLQNPNEVSVEGADPDLLLNGVQLDFADFFNAASGGNIQGKTTIGVDQLVRMQAMTTGYRYQTAAQPQFIDDIWQIGYQNVLVNAETLIALGSKNNLSTHVAIGKILSAYVYLTLVDLFGDVPQSEALKGPAGNFNPVADPGESVYNHALTLLTEAHAELAKTGTDAGPAVGRDVYYGGDRAKWDALANTIELKAWLNISMIAARKAEADEKIAALLAADLVDTEDENFVYQYGTATVPVSRHPLYNQYYGPSAGSAVGYISNYYLYELYNGKGVQDPRWRYYFYRQVGSIAKANEIDPKSIGCSVGAIPEHYQTGNFVFCIFDPGFYGRDHGDASGLPPDTPVITAAGVYPAGGKIDNTSITNEGFAQATVRGDGADGAGIQPIFMSFYTDYLKAEILARNGDVAAARDRLLNPDPEIGAIAKSISQIRNFATSRGQILSDGREPDTGEYLAAVGTLYDNTANKLDIIGREFWVACWGNGIEAYNNYRRTSAPRNPQPTRQINPGPFLRSLVYPSAYVNLNSNATQKDVDVTNRVFWDTNPDELN